MFEEYGFYNMPSRRILFRFGGLGNNGANSGGGGGDGAVGRFSSPFGSAVNFDTSSATGNSAPLPANPVLPMFTQLNVRFAGGASDSAYWREASRYGSQILG